MLATVDPLARIDLVASSRSQGFSLVELLVGMSLGLLVATAAIRWHVSQIQESRRLALESSLMLDLQAAGDLVLRHLRRAGHWPEAPLIVATDTLAPQVQNPHATLILGPETTSSIQFSYGETVATDEPPAPYGIRLRDGILQIRLRGGSWQALNDASRMQVTDFALRPIEQTQNLAGYCPTPCDHETGCEPRLIVRQWHLSLGVRATSEPHLYRSVQQRVRQRNSVIEGQCQ